MTILAGLYETQDAARAAETDLLRRGYHRETIHVISGQGDDDALRTGIRDARVGAAQAGALAEGVRRGQTLVVIDAPFGYAQDADDILHRHDPVGGTQTGASLAASGAGAREYGHDNAAPFSRALGIPVLSRDPAPLSSWLGLRTLKPDAGPGSRKTVRKLSANAAPLSRTLGLPVLSRGLPSQVFGPLLSHKAAPLSDAAKWPTLLGEPAPLSKKLGWRTLLKDPAPLSSLLGLPVLIRSGRR